MPTRMISILAIAVALYAPLEGFAEEKAGETAAYEKFTADDPALDRNGDDFLDIIVQKHKVHYDIDFDGKFDYTLAMAFPEYTTKGHLSYLNSDFSRDLFSDLTMKGLKGLCVNERMAASWTENNYGTFDYYHNGYGYLSLFSDSPENDGRLTSRKHRGTYDYRVTFNPDGSVGEVTRGEESVMIAGFDFESNTSSGEKIFLPKIEKADDLNSIRASLKKFFP